MNWIFFGIVTMLVLLLAWVIRENKRESRKDQEIFDESLANQSNLRLTRRESRRGTQRTKAGECSTPLI